MSDDTEIVIRLVRAVAERLLVCLQYDIPVEPGTAEAVLAAIQAALKS